MRRSARTTAASAFDAQVERLGNAILERAGQRALDLPSALFALFLDALSVFVISLLLVTNRERILGFTLTLVHPDDRKFVGGLLEKMWTRVGAYLRAKLIVMAIVGALTYVTLLLIGVPFALVLAIIVALGEAIPRAGPWLARIPLLGSRRSRASPRSAGLRRVDRDREREGLLHLAVRRGRPARHPPAARVHVCAGRRNARRVRRRVHRRGRLRRSSISSSARSSSRGASGTSPSAA